MTIDEVLFDAEEKMLKTEDHVLNQFSGVRTGKATPSRSTWLAAPRPTASSG